MGELADAIKRAAEKLKDPNHQPPGIEPVDLPPIPEQGRYHVTFLQRRGMPTAPSLMTEKPNQQ